MKQFAWDSFLKDCFRQRYILVLGNEIILEEKYEKGNALLFLSKMFKESEGSDWDDFLQNYRIPLEYFNQRLYELLNLKFFRVVITTTVDNLLERVMRKIWGNQLKVINFYDEDNDYLPKQRNEFYETQPILYYAFGKALNGGTYACGEDNKLQIVSDWLNHSSNGFPSQFYNYIQTKKLLALGCKQDDWLFRFFWYSLRRNVRVLKSLEDDTFVKKTEKRYSGTVAIELDDCDKNDIRLKKYIKKNATLYDDNAQNFVTDFLAMMSMNEENELLKDMISNNSLGGCFISYAHEDYQFAFNLYLALKEKGFSVWIDNDRLYPGADYEGRILKAIDECDVFLPILSEVVNRDYLNGEFAKIDGERYYLKEWKYASKRKMKIIPVLCEGFDVKFEAYKNTPWYDDADRTVYKKGEDSLNRLIKGLNELGYGNKANKSIG